MRKKDAWRLKTGTKVLVKSANVEIKITEIFHIHNYIDVYGTDNNGRVWHTYHDAIKKVENPT